VDARVLRWTFRRAEQSVICELSLTTDHSAYELRFDPPWSPARVATEQFDDVLGAFLRQTAVERTLMDEGWSLARFELQANEDSSHRAPGSVADSGGV